MMCIFYDWRCLNIGDIDGYCPLPLGSNNLIFKVKSNSKIK